MESVARWVDGLAFEGTFSTGHTLRMDASVEQGGQDSGPRPIELLLVGLAGCTGMDVLAILKRKKQEVTALSVAVSGERRKAQPNIFTKLRVTYEVTGRSIDAEAVRQAVHLSEDKYCSVAAMLRCAAPISREIRITEAKG